MWSVDHLFLAIFRGTSKYKNETYPCIKGTEKDITAFFLKGENPGFYIYNPENDKFFKMTNVRIHSRLFTIVKPTKLDDILDNYEKISAIRLL